MDNIFRVLSQSFSDGGDGANDAGGGADDAAGSAGDGCVCSCVYSNMKWTLSEECLKWPLNKTDATAC